MTRPVALITAVSAALVLAACSSPAEPGATAASSPSPSASASASTAPTSEAIVIGAETLAVVAADGQTREFDYFDDREAAIEALTTVLGEPRQEPAETDGSEPVRYDWGGFVLTDQVGDGDREGYSTDYSVTASAASVGGVPIRTVDGVAVGDPFAEIDASDGDAPEEHLDADTGTSFTWARVDVVALDGLHDGANVGVALTGSGDVVEEVDAPAANFGE